jgi:MSHA biogenesis protein MshP
MNTARARGTGQPGFALVPALFLLVVLAALGLVAIRVGSGEQQTVIQGLLQSRALAAARSGVEWGAWQALHGSCAGSTALALNESALAGFAVTVTCSATNWSNGAATSHAYLINATAIAGTYGQPGYVRRVLRSTFTDAG